MKSRVETTNISTADEKDYDGFFGLVPAVLATAHFGKVYPVKPDTKGMTFCDPLQ